MPPKKNDYVDQIRASFLREFNNAKKQYEAEAKQNPFLVAKTSVGFEIEICVN